MKRAKRSAGIPEIFRALTERVDQLAPIERHLAWIVNEYDTATPQEKRALLSYLAANPNPYGVADYKRNVAREEYPECGLVDARLLEEETYRLVLETTSGRGVSLYSTRNHRNEPFLESRDKLEVLADTLEKLGPHARELDIRIEHPFGPVQHGFRVEPVGDKGTEMLVRYEPLEKEDYFWVPGLNLMGDLEIPRVSLSKKEIVKKEIERTLKKAGITFTERNEKYGDTILYVPKIIEKEKLGEWLSDIVDEPYLYIKGKLEWREGPLSGRVNLYLETDANPAREAMLRLESRTGVRVDTLAKDWDEQVESVFGEEILGAMKKTGLKEIPTPQAKAYSILTLLDLSGIVETTGPRLEWNTLEPTRYDHIKAKAKNVAQSIKTRI